jgi:hypothetical protein
LQFRLRVLLDLELQEDIIMIELFFTASESATVWRDEIKFLFGRIEQLEGHIRASGVSSCRQRRVFDEEVK